MKADKNEIVLSLDIKELDKPQPQLVSILSLVPWGEIGCTEFNCIYKFSWNEFANDYVSFRIMYFKVENISTGGTHLISFNSLRFIFNLYESLYILHYLLSCWFISRSMIQIEDIFKVV